MIINKVFNCSSQIDGKEFVRQCRQFIQIVRIIQIIQIIRINRIIQIIRINQIVEIRKISKIHQLLIPPIHVLWLIDAAALIDVVTKAFLKEIKQIIIMRQMTVNSHEILGLRGRHLIGIQIFWPKIGVKVEGIYSGKDEN